MVIPAPREITELQKEMINTIKEHDFNFQHPDVIEISQKIDVLILEVMRKQQSFQS